MNPVCFVSRIGSALVEGAKSTLDEAVFLGTVVRELTRTLFSGEHENAQKGKIPTHIVNMLRPVRIAEDYSRVKEAKIARIAEAEVQEAISQAIKEVKEEDEEMIGQIVEEVVERASERGEKAAVIKRLNEIVQRIIEKTENQKERKQIISELVQAKIEEVKLRESFENVIKEEMEKVAEGIEQPKDRYEALCTALHSIYTIQRQMNHVGRLDVLEETVESIERKDEESNKKPITETFERSIEEAFSKIAEVIEKVKNKIKEQKINKSTLPKLVEELEKEFDAQICEIQDELYDQVTEAEKVIYSEWDNTRKLIEGAQ